MKSVPPTPGFLTLLLDQGDHFHLFHIVLQSSARLAGFALCVVGSISWGWMKLDKRGWIALLGCNFALFFSLFLVHILGSPARGGHHSFGEEISLLFDERVGEEDDAEKRVRTDQADLSEEVRKGEARIYIYIHPVH
jgi:hypothetical protein